MAEIANKFRDGSLVELGADGRLGQVVRYSDEQNAYEVAPVDSAGTVFLDPASLSTPLDFKKPGMDGAADNSFDVLYGPATDQAALAAEMATCLFERGFCVIRVCQDVQATLAAVEKVREQGDQGFLGRLPVEVEEGYLGTGAQGKIMWLDQDNASKFHDAALDAADSTITSITELLQPHSMDVLGGILDERTPALVSLSLLPGDEEDYPSPLADDKVLGDYLGTWRYGLLRAVTFLGPTSPTVTLSNKGGAKSAAVPKILDSVSLEPAPNTIVLFRTELYEYSCASEDEVLTMTVNLLTEAPEWVLDSWAGETSALRTASNGPKDAPGNRITVMQFQTRLAAQWDEPEAMLAGLNAGCDCVTTIPIARFDVDFYYVEDPNEMLTRPRPATIQRHTSFCDGVEMFDNKYFEISVNEASGMGPMQRQVLEVGGALLAKEGITKKTTNRVSHLAGCSVGLDKDDFPELMNSGYAQLPGGGGNNAMAIIANRFSFVFNLKGTNYVCDTACSSSLTATHLSKLLLLDRKIDPMEFHIAMGIHLCLSPMPWIGTSLSRMVSPEGRCFTFDAAANGYLRGEGTSGMYLKYGPESLQGVAVYRASQSGQDGRSASLTAPNGPAQEHIIKNAMKEAAMTSTESTTWDCHGTGTSLGDPIEVGAVRKVMIKMERPEPLMLTTVKSYIGHMEGGAAMAAICKALTQVSRCECFASNHLRQVNPNLENTTFDAFFVSDTTKFQYPQGLAHVSSFGFGGTNGHIVFWGESLGVVPNVSEMVLRKLAKLPPPEVRAIGDDPADWETDGPDFDAAVNDRYTITFSSADPPDMPAKWDKAEAAAPVDDDDVFFAITGNFNGWESDRMSPGTVPHHHVATATVPDNGVLEFRFLQNDDTDEVVGPKIANCTRMSAPIMGPKRDVTNSWVINAEPGTDFQIELLMSSSQRGVVWIRQ